MGGNDWLYEKSESIIKTLCYLRAHVKGMETDMPSHVYDPMHDIYNILYNATKIYCSCISESYDDSNNRWSPDLPKYLFDHPEKCEEALRIIASKEYNDRFYDPDFRRLFRTPEDPNAD